LLDEPTIGLDIISQSKIRQFFKTYNQTYNTTILLTSHYMRDIEDLCSRTMIINHGQLVYDGDLKSVNDVIGSWKLLKIQLSAPVSELSLNGYGKIRSRSELEVVFELSKHDVLRKSKEILDHLPVIDFTIEDIPLEEGIAILYEKGGLPHAQ